MYIRLERSEALTPDIWTFWFRPLKPCRFIAGQYINIRVPHTSPDSRGQERWMTISSTPAHPLLGITTQFVPNPSTYKQALRRLQPGSTLYASAAIGDFVLPKDTSVPVVFVALGIGITPVESMVRDALEKHETRTLQVLHGARRQGDLLYRATFQQSPSTAYVPVLSQPDTDWSGHTGRLDATRIMELSGDSADKLFYMTGPEPPILELIDGLRRLGVAKQQIVIDYFPGYIE